MVNPHNIDGAEPEALIEDEGENKAATINMMSNGGADYQRQIDEHEEENNRSSINMMSNGGSDYQRQIDDYDAENNRVSTINMMSNGGADYQNQIAIRENELRQASLEKDEMSDGFDVFGGMRGEGGKSVLKDASLSPQEMRNTLGSSFDVFGGLRNDKQNAPSFFEGLTHPAGKIPKSPIKVNKQSISVSPFAGLFSRGGERDVKINIKSGSGAVVYPAGSSYFGVTQPKRTGGILPGTKMFGGDIFNNMDTMFAQNKAPRVTRSKASAKDPFAVDVDVPFVGVNTPTSTKRTAARNTREWNRNLKRQKEVNSIYRDNLKTSESRMNASEKNAKAAKEHNKFLEMRASTTERLESKRAELKDFGLSRSFNPIESRIGDVKLKTSPLVLPKKMPTDPGEKQKIINALNSERYAKSVSPLMKKVPGALWDSDKNPITIFKPIPSPNANKRTEMTNEKFVQNIDEEYGAWQKSHPAAHAKAQSANRQHMKRLYKENPSIYASVFSSGSNKDPFEEREEAGQQAYSKDPNEKPGGRRSSGVNQWEKMTVFEKEMFGGSEPAGGVNVGQLKNKHSEMRTMAEKFKGEHTDVFLKDIKTGMRSKSGRDNYWWSTPVTVARDKRNEQKANAYFVSQSKYGELTPDERSMYYNDVMPLNYSKKSHDKVVSKRNAKIEQFRQFETAAFISDMDVDIKATPGSYGWTIPGKEAIAKQKTVKEEEDRKAQSDIDEFVFKQDKERHASHEKFVEGQREAHWDKVFGLFKEKEKNIKQTEKFEDVLATDEWKTYHKEEKRKDEKRKAASGFDVAKSALGSIFYDPTLNKKTAKGVDKYKSIFSGWHDPELKGLGRERAKINAKQTVTKPWNDLLEGQKQRAETHRKNMGFLYGGGLQPSEYGTKEFPRGHFPAKSGYPTRLRNPLAYSELSFFGGRGTPFGIRKPLKGTLNKRTGRIKISAAERKRAQRQAKKQPRGFFDDLFGGM